MQNAAAMLQNQLGNSVCIGAVAFACNYATPLHNLNKSNLVMIPPGLSIQLLNYFGNTQHFGWLLEVATNVPLSPLRDMPQCCHRCIREKSCSLESIQQLYLESYLHFLLKPQCPQGKFLKPNQWTVRSTGHCKLPPFYSRILTSSVWRLRQFDTQEPGRERKTAVLVQPQWSFTLCPECHYSREKSWQISVSACPRVLESKRKFHSCGCMEIKREIQEKDKTENYNKRIEMHPHRKWFLHG